MPSRIETGAVVEILFGSFIPGPQMGSQAMGSVLGTSIEAGAGLLIVSYLA
ncbi:MAG TPA: hypothetical protein HA306_07370 [Methanosarcina sp.]|nr:hypothetical protein [Methanosarcina sp.]